MEIRHPDGTPVMDANKDGQILTYHIPTNLVKFLDKVKAKINQNDKDYVLIIDGYEGSGKSTFAQQIGIYVDSTLCLSRICMTADEFKQAIIDAKKGECVIYDEAVTGMSASDSITRIGRLLKSMMMQMRQKNLFVIVIIPTVFELGKYAILSRARCLFHIFEKNNVHKWIAYNKKDLKKLYIKGKKNYAYTVKSFFGGRFFGKMTVNEKEYRKKKEDALFLLDEPEKKEDKYYQRNLIIKALYKQHYPSTRKLSAWLKSIGVKLEQPMVSTITGEKLENAHSE